MILQTDCWIARKKRFKEKCCTDLYEIPEWSKIWENREQGYIPQQKEPALTWNWVQHCQPDPSGDIFICLQRVIFFHLSAKAALLAEEWFIIIVEIVPCCIHPDKPPVLEYFKMICPGTGSAVGIWKHHGRLVWSWFCNACSPWFI